MLDPKEIEGLLDRRVVLDTDTHYVYLGTLKSWGESFVQLADVDVHDSSEGRSNKDLYIIEACRGDNQINRRQVLVNTRHVVSISKIEDVIVY